MSNNILMHLRIFLISALLVGIFGLTPAHVNAELADTTRQDCEPNSGWMWVNGSLKPDVANRVQQELAQKGIDALVEARSYGEVDSCGTYSEHGVDFKINLKDTESNRGRSRQELVDTILPTLRTHGKPNLGNTRLISAQGESIPVDVATNENSISTSQVLSTDALATDPIVKRVYVIVYDPLLSDGRTLSQYAGWNSHATITQQTIDFFNTSTNGRLNYTVVATSIVTSGWPELIDGFTYTESTFLPVLANPSIHHEPTGVNYNKIVNSPEFDICGKLNRGDIDEVWVYNGPWFGFYESTLVGPGAYPMNSSPVGGSHNCNKLVPIMGPSVERTVDEAVHNFTHRTEDTMKKVYGSWQENDTSHSWNKFALVKAQSPNYSYSGCGSSHYPPNGVTDYDYGNASSVLSNCADFVNYPNLSDPLVVSQPVACKTWGCTQLGYFRYWFGHFPVVTGCGPDNAANDWWRYITNPGIALYPSYACQIDMRAISGNAGAGGVTLSYTDGTARNVLSDSYGNYFFFVSNHWTGTVTPSRAGYTFSPAGKSYADVQGDLYNQDYSSQGTGAPAFYVNIATGDNSNPCTSPSAPCRTIQETVNKATAGDIIYVASGTYVFSTNGSPNVVIINNDLTLSGGWNADFTSQNGASTIDGANMNNGILILSGTVRVENFIIEKSTSFNSGAVYIVNGNVTISRSTLRNNHATSNGAGIFVDNGTLNVINSTISGNQANSMGGGIYAANNSGAAVTIQNSTVAFNSASTGGGISRTNGTYNITNTILANNFASASSPDCYGTINAANFNIIENTTGCSIVSGSNNLNTDPQIDSSLTGVLPVHMLLATSPAINAGTTSGCPAVDQVGTTRPQDSSCDIGSIEYSAPVGDTVAPTVLAVTRASANPTIATTVDFNINFSEDVTGVDTSDFLLTTSGISNASINGISGSGNSYTVTISTGSGSGTIRLDVVDDDSVVDVALNPLGGTGLANGNFTSGEIYTVSQIVSLTVYSAAANDGWILESNENTNVGGSLNILANTIDIGDDKYNKQYVGVLHFDTSSLPDTAIITSITLQVKKQGLSGTDPFTTHSSLLADVQKPYFGTSAGLVTGDFQAVAGGSAMAAFNSIPVNNWYSAAVDSSGYTYVNLSGTTQFRLRFTLDDDNDRRADFVKLYSGEASLSNRPRLIIQYYVP